MSATAISRQEAVAARANALLALAIAGDGREVFTHKSLAARLRCSRPQAIRAENVLVGEGRVRRELVSWSDHGGVAGFRLAPVRKATAGPILPRSAARRGAWNTAVRRAFIERLERLLASLGEIEGAVLTSLQLADRLGCSPRQARYALKKLCAAGLVRKQRERAADGADVGFRLRLAAPMHAALD